MASGDKQPEDVGGPHVVTGALNPRRSTSELPLLQYNFTVITETRNCSYTYVW